MGMAMSTQDPVPVNRVRVYVTREVNFNFEKMQQVLRNILGRLGCEACHSGRIIDFHIIEDFVVNPKSLEVTELPGGFR